MKSRDVLTTHDFNMSLIEKADNKNVEATFWIDKTMDTLFINIKGVRGGIMHYTSDHDGLLVSGEGAVIGMFFEGLLKNIETSDNTEIELRKFRYIEGEK